MNVTGSTPRAGVPRTLAAIRRVVPGLLSLSAHAGLWPVTSFAQAAPSATYAYCQVEDTGNRQIWVSQVFPAPPSAGALALDLATEFHAYVATLGGAGNKQCVVSTREQAEATRAQVAQIMGKRVFGMRVYSWHDVQWTPSAATYARTSSPAPSAVTTQQFVYCRLTDTDARTMVTSRVFGLPLARADQMSHFTALDRWAKAFGHDAAAAYRVAPDALCIASDTVAEADKNLTDYQHAFRFSGIKHIEMAWTPPVDTSPATVANPAASDASAGASDDVEAELWRRVSSSTQAADYDDYLAAYPQGRHAPIARLEARRLRDGGTTARTSTKGAKTARAVKDTGAPPQADASKDAIVDSGATVLEQRIAKEAFFRVPAGSGAPVERSGTRRVGTVQVTSTLNTRRAAGNVCDMASVSVASGSFETRYTGHGWAGLLPVEGTVQSRSPYGSGEYSVRTTSVSALEGQPFPLQEGSAFGYTFSQVTTGAGAPPVTNVMANRCVVGGTGLAAALVPGLAGSATELTCTLSFQDTNLPPQQQKVHWFEAAGCFVQDPTR